MMIYIAFISRLHMRVKLYGLLHCKYVHAQDFMIVLVSGT